MDFLWTFGPRNGLGDCRQGLRRTKLDSLQVSRKHVIDLAVEASSLPSCRQRTEFPALVRFVGGLASSRRHGNAWFFREKLVSQVVNAVYDLVFPFENWPAKNSQAPRQKLSYGSVGFTSRQTRYCLASLSHMRGFLP
jgi:hypothetical protein